MLHPINSNLLARLSEAIAQPQNTVELLRIIVAELQPIFKFHDVGLFVINEAKDYHIDLAAVAPDISPSEENYLLSEQDLQLPYRGSVVAYAIEQIAAAGRPVVLDFQHLMQRFPDYPQWKVVRPTGFRDCLATTLQVQGKITGLFCLNALTKDHFQAEQFPLFQAIADRVSIALSHMSDPIR